MDEQFPHIMTLFDEYISNPSLQMAKVLIPFLPPDSQRIIAVYIKFSELKYTLSFFRKMKQIPSKPEDILDSLKPYLSSSDLESFEQMQNMMEMISMMQEMQNTSDMDFDPMSVMTEMFSQKEGETND